MFDPDKSTTANLLDAGFGHRKVFQHGTLGKRVIFDMKTGVEHGLMDCFQANDWLRALDVINHV